MRVKDIGEFDLIDVLIEVIERRGLDRAGPEGRLLRIGAGDDAAAWEGPGGVEVLTNDVMVEGVHFDLATIGWRDLGWKCVAVNLSDVAAMGCLPGFAVVALGLPGGLRVADLVEMYEGMLDACERYGCALVGGDVVRSPTFFVSVAVTGMAQTDGGGPPAWPLLARDGARVGDLVAVTGHVGCSAGGLRMMTEGRELDDETATHLRLAHVRPTPRVSEGAALARHGAHAAIDVSDGLLDDLGKLCRASGVGAVVRVDRLPADDHPAGRIPERMAVAGPRRRRGLRAPDGGDGGHVGEGRPRGRHAHVRHRRDRAGGCRRPRRRRAGRAGQRRDGRLGPLPESPTSVIPAQGDPCITVIPAKAGTLHNRHSREGMTINRGCNPSFPRK